MKMKTKKIVAKRFKVTKNGILMRRRQNSRHLRVHKSKSQIKRYRKNTTVTGAIRRTVLKFIPYL